MKTITTVINDCNDCPHKDHTGGFTPGGSKPCCDHSETVKLKGNNCFDRIIPYKTNEYEEIKIGAIPDWCPL